MRLQLDWKMVPGARKPCLLKEWWCLDTCSWLKSLSLLWRCRRHELSDCSVKERHQGFVSDMKLSQIRLKRTPGMFWNVYDRSGAYFHAGGVSRHQGAGWLESQAATVGNWPKLWAKRTTYHCHLSRWSNHSGDDEKLIYTVLVSHSNKKMMQNVCRYSHYTEGSNTISYNLIRFPSIQTRSIDSVHECKRKQCRLTLLPLADLFHHLDAGRAKSELKMLWGS